MHHLAQVMMTFKDKLDIAIARGYISQENNVIILPEKFAANVLFPSFRKVKPQSVHRALRRAGYRRVSRGRNSWMRREDCV